MIKLKAVKMSWKQQPSRKHVVQYWNPTMLKWQDVPAEPDTTEALILDAMLAMKPDMQVIQKSIQPPAVEWYEIQWMDDRGVWMQIPMEADTMARAKSAINIIQENWLTETKDEEKQTASTDPSTAPDVIWLQGTISEVWASSTWCVDQIEDDDVKYVQVHQTDIETIQPPEWKYGWNNRPYMEWQLIVDRLDIRTLATIYLDLKQKPKQEQDTHYYHRFFSDILIWKMMARPLDDQQLFESIVGASLPAIPENA